MAASREVRLALIYQAEALHQHLKQALTELGARVVYEAPANGFEQDAFDRANADVVLINLEGGDDFAALEALLADDSRRVIFDDGEVSSRLEGWDLARWTRHLAAKVLDVPDVDPPRPKGAVAVPVRVKAGPGSVHEAGNAPAFEILGAELENALAADTDAAIERTRAELVTELEPVRTEFEANAFEHPEWSLVTVDADDAESPAQAGVPRHDAPTVEIEFDPGSVGLPEFAEGAVPHYGAPPVEIEFDPGSVGLPEFAEGAVPRWPATEEPVTDPAAGSYLEDAFKALGFIDVDVNAAPPRPAELVVDLDTLLMHASEVEQERSRGSIGKSPEALASARAADAESAARAMAATRPQTAPARPAPTAHRSLADFEAALAGVSLAPLDEPPPMPSPTESARTVSEKPRTDFGSTFGSLSLEPLEGDLPTRQTSGRASFAVPDEQPAPRAPASSAPARMTSSIPSPPPSATGGDDGLSLEGFEFTLPTGPESPGATGGAANDAEDMSVDLELEIEALLAREAEDMAIETAMLQRVWVLGASIGGPDAVREFLGALPAGVPALFLLAQHVGADFLELMVQQLTKAVRLRVRNASNGGVLAHGEVVVVPLAERLLIERDGTMQVVPSAEASAYSPSIDQALRDVADRFGADAGAIIFSGMAHDAIDGAKYLKEKGGTVWVQDPSTCVISSMVDGAREAGIVEFTGTPLQLAQKFVAEFGGS